MPRPTESMVATGKIRCWVGVTMMKSGRKPEMITFAAARNDYVDGGLGSDTIYGDEGQDIIFGATGDDTIDGGSGGDLLSGGVAVSSPVPASG